MQRSRNKNIGQQNSIEMQIKHAKKSGMWQLIPYTSPLSRICKNVGHYYRPSSTGCFHVTIDLEKPNKKLEIFYHKVDTHFNLKSFLYFSEVYWETS